MQGAEDVSDLILLQRTAAGDRAAFAVVVERHRSGVYRYARSLCRTPQEAEDVFQETFVQALRGASTFEGGSTRSWLLTIARRSLLRMRRLRVGQPGQLEPLESLGAKAGWGDPEGPKTLARIIEERDLLDKAFRCLEETDREVLLACDVEGLSGAEACTLLALSPSALKSRLHRARLRLAAAAREVVELEDRYD